MKVFSAFKTACACLAMLATGCATATVITVTFPAFTDNNFYSGPFPRPQINLGTRSFVIPTGERISSATIEGSIGPTGCDGPCFGTGGVVLRLNAIEVASCVGSNDRACGFGNGLPAFWQHGFSDSELAALNVGSATLSEVQTSAGSMRLGVTTLTITTVAIAPSNCTITPSPSGPVNPGTAVALTVNCANNPTTFIWSANGVTVGTTQSIVVTPTQTTTYAVTASNDGGPAQSSITVQVNQSTGISYVSGDNQLGNAGAVLPNPLVVKVVNGQGNPFPAAQFVSQVTGGSGTLTLLTPQPADGLYQFSFRFGAETTARTVTVCLADHPSLCVVFHESTFEQVVTIPAKQLIGPQAATAVGAPTVQLNNVRRRLEQIRLWGNPTVTQGLRVSYDGQSLPPLSAFALAPLDQEGKPRLGAGEGTAGRPQTGGGGAADTPDAFERWSVFVNGNIDIGRQSTVEDQTGFKLNTKGITIGTDYRFAGNNVLGAAVGFLRGDADLDAGAGNQDAKGYSFTVYGTYVPIENAYIDGMVNVGHNRYDSQRLTPTAAFDSQTSGNQWGLALSVGYAVNRGALALTPYGRVEYVDAKVDAFTESGDPSEALIIGDQRIKATTLTLGGTASYAIGTSWGVLVPNARLEFQYLAQSSANDVSARIATSAPTQIQILGPDKSFGNFAVGVTALFGRGVSAFFNYQQLFGKSNVSDRLYTLGLNVAF